MKESTHREKVLKAVRKALIHKSEADYSIADGDPDIYTAPEEESLELLFAKNFSNLKGRFVFCENKQDFATQLADLIKNKTGITCFAPSTR